MNACGCLCTEGQGGIFMQVSIGKGDMIDVKDYGIFADSPQGPRLGYEQRLAWSSFKPDGSGKMGPHCCGACE